MKLALLLHVMDGFCCCLVLYGVFKLNVLLITKCMQSVSSVSFVPFTYGAETISYQQLNRKECIAETV